MESETLILVDDKDNEIGNDSKTNCHYREPKLHRALSVFVFNAARYSNEWGEKELDWVYAGRHDGPIKPDPGEITAWKFVSARDLKNDMKKNPGNYTPWFKLCAEKVIERIRGF